jgi:hypothetical protein
VALNRTELGRSVLGLVGPTELGYDCFFASLHGISIADYCAFLLAFRRTMSAATVPRAATSALPLSAAHRENKAGWPSISPRSKQAGCGEYCD